MAVQRFAMYGRLGLVPDCSPRLTGVRLLRGSLPLYSTYAHPVCDVVAVRSAKTMALRVAAMKQTLLVALLDLLASTAVAGGGLIMLHYAALLGWRALINRGYYSCRAARHASLELRPLRNVDGAPGSTACEAAGNGESAASELSTACAQPAPQYTALPMTLVPPHLEVGFLLLYGPGLFEASMAVLGTAIGGIAYRPDEKWQLGVALASACTVGSLYALNGRALLHFCSVEQQQPAVCDSLAATDEPTRSEVSSSEPLLDRSLQCLGSRCGSDGVDRRCGSSDAMAGPSTVPWVWLGGTEGGSRPAVLSLFFQGVLQLVIALLVGVFEHDLIPGRSNRLPIELTLISTTLGVAALSTAYSRVPCSLRNATRQPTSRPPRRAASLLGAVTAAGYMMELAGLGLLLRNGSTARSRVPEAAYYCLLVAVSAPLLATMLLDVSAIASAFGVAGRLQTCFSISA